MKDAPKAARGRGRRERYQTWDTFHWENETGSRLTPVSIALKSFFPQAVPEESKGAEESLYQPEQREEPSQETVEGDDKVAERLSV
jgi:hypothetical protein